MTMSTQYGGDLFWWTLDNPHEQFTLIMDAFKRRIEAGENLGDEVYRAFRYWEDPRFEYLDGIHTWGGGRFTKALKIEYRKAFDDWCLAKDKPLYNHDIEHHYMSMSGTVGDSMFITVDPVNHPPPSSL